MKKLIVLCLCMLMLCSCGKTADSPAAALPTPSASTAPALPQSAPSAVPAQTPQVIDIDITEKMYVHWINEIYYNGDLYEGKTVRLQGMYAAETNESGSELYHFVYRKGPGCCGSDGDMCGFEFLWDGAVPQEGAWIEVVGKVGIYTAADGFTYLGLYAESVEQKEAERGAEVVAQ